MDLIKDLGLYNNKGSTPWGNCDLCFLKGPRQVKSMIREKPGKAIWWARQEAWATEELGESTRTGDGFRFRNDRPSYQTILDQVAAQTELFPSADPDEEMLACFCGD